MAKKQVIFALGGNSAEGEFSVEEQLHDAIRQMVGFAGLSLADADVSHLYETPAWPDPSRPAYLNAVAAFLTDKPAEQLLTFAHYLEDKAGRIRSARNADRPLDIDLIAADTAVHPAQATWQEITSRLGDNMALPQLMIPHPRAHLRAFVLRPLRDIAPVWRHPVMGRTAEQLLADLPISDTEGVRCRKRWDKDKWCAV